jgi:hypothetical protein
MFLSRRNHAEGTCRAGPSCFFRFLSWLRDYCHYQSTSASTPESLHGVVSKSRNGRKGQVDAPNYAMCEVRRLACRIASEVNPPIVCACAILCPIAVKVSVTNVGERERTDTCGTRGRLRGPVRSSGWHMLFEEAWRKRLATVCMA